jgi:hypothetical protein
MRAYSMDIQERVIENLDQESMRKTAKRFRVYFCLRKVEKLLSLSPPVSSKEALRNESSASSRLAKPAEIRSFLRHQLPPARTQEL